MFLSVFSVQMSGSGGRVRVVPRAAKPRVVVVPVVPKPSLLTSHVSFRRIAHNHSIQTKYRFVKPDAAAL